MLTTLFLVFALQVQPVQPNPADTHQIGPGDVVRVALRAPKTTVTVEVPEDGLVTLPVVQTIRVAGLTRQQLRERLEKDSGGDAFVLLVRIRPVTPRRARTR